MGGLPDKTCQFSPFGLSPDWQQYLQIVSKTPHIQQTYSATTPDFLPRKLLIRCHAGDATGLAWWGTFRYADLTEFFNLLPS